MSSYHVKCALLNCNHQAWAVQKRRLCIILDGSLRTKVLRPKIMTL